MFYASRILLLLASLMLFFAPGAALSKQQVIWITDDYREIEHLALNTHLNITTDSLKLLLAGLTEFNIEFREALLPRAKKLVFNRENVCGVNWVKTKERAANSHYSLPFTIYPGLRLYYLDGYSQVPMTVKNKQNQLISLAALIKSSPDSVLGIVKGRSYGVFIDGQLNALEPSSKYIRSGRQPYRSIESMLVKRRINYLIEFPSEMTDFERKYNLDGQLRSIEIAGAEPYLVGHIACSKSEIGEQMIAAIDKGLIELYGSAEYLTAHLRHISPYDRSSFINFYRNLTSPLK